MWWMILGTLLLTNAFILIWLPNMDIEALILLTVGIICLLGADILKELRSRR